MIDPLYVPLITTPIATLSSEIEAELEINSRRYRSLADDMLGDTIASIRQAYSAGASHAE